MNNKNLIQLQQTLHHCLQPIEHNSHSECIFLDYPDYLNLGDHLIWLGSILYLVNNLNMKINYSASREQFAAIEMTKIKKKIPIFLNGGGNLGDLWIDIQNFRETIIKQYHQHPIIILPQSIYFQKTANLEKTAKIFNQHPDLTIFVRDNYSYDIATNAFNQCKIFKSPDMALEMIDCLNLSKKEQKSKIFLVEL